MAAPADVLDELQSRVEQGDSAASAALVVQLRVALEARDQERQALVTVGVSRSREIDKLRNHNLELERSLREAGVDVPSTSSTPRGSTHSFPRSDVSPRPSARSGALMVESSTQTMGASLGFAAAERQTASSVASDEYVQPVRPGGTASFVRGETPPGRGYSSRTDTPLHHHPSSFNRRPGSTTSSMQGDRAAYESAAYAALGDSVSQVAMHSGRGSPNNRGPPPNLPTGHHNHHALAGEASLTGSLPRRPQRPRLPSAQSASQPRPMPAPQGAAGSSAQQRQALPDALRIVAEELGPHLAVGTACTVAAWVLYRLLLRS